MLQRITTTKTACLIAAATVVAALTLLAAPEPALGYDRYSDGCRGCHGDFTSDSYSSRATGEAWPSSLHTVHRSSGYMNAECDLCHAGGDGWDPYIGQSTGTNDNDGLGCVGCHGGLDSQGQPSGMALQRVHVATGAASCYPGCHSASEAPQQEQVAPPYYGSADSNVVSACNSDAGTTEDWNNDGQGLDNDADLLFDAADPACQPGFTFHDGFVSGDLSAWSQSTQ